MIPRGIRNNNPGNIRINKERWQGEIQPSQDNAFKQFSSMAYGYRAIFKLLYNYQHTHGCRRLGEFISRWAPPTENNTNAYIRTVCQHCGIAGLSDLSIIDTTDARLMKGIVAGMSFVENGIEADADDVNAGWELFAKELEI